MASHASGIKRVAAANKPAMHTGKKSKLAVSTVSSPSSHEYGEASQPRVIDLTALIKTDNNNNANNELLVRYILGLSTQIAVYKNNITGQYSTCIGKFTEQASQQGFEWQKQKYVTINFNELVRLRDRFLPAILLSVRKGEEIEDPYPFNDELYLTISKQYKSVDLRKFWRNEEGILKPGRPGANINLKLIEGLDRALDLIFNDIIPADMYSPCFHQNQMEIFECPTCAPVSLGVVEVN